jgi:enoyl-CoA hydratase/carnithine racemase
MENIIVHNNLSDSVVEIILNRPHRRNALTGPMVEELITAFENINANSDVNVVVLRGAENAFCSGLDLKEFGAEPAPSWKSEFPDKWRHLHCLIFDSSKILVGAIEGSAINAGSALALACDISIVGNSSKLQVGEIQRGMAAPMNIAWLRLRHSEALAARLTLLGDPVIGPDIVALGIAHNCVDDDQVVDHAHEIAARIGSFNIDGVKQMKRSLRHAYFAGTAEEWFASQK